MRRCISYARGAWGSHTREATVFYHSKEVVYEIPIYWEPRGTLKNVITEKDRIIMIYETTPTTSQDSQSMREYYSLPDQSPLTTPHSGTLTKYCTNPSDDYLKPQ